MHFSPYACLFFKIRQLAEICICYKCVRKRRLHTPACACEQLGASAGSSALAGYGAVQADTSVGENGHPTLATLVRISREIEKKKSWRTLMSPPLSLDRYSVMAIGDEVDAVMLSLHTYTAAHPSHVY